MVESILTSELLIEVILGRKDTQVVEVAKSAGKSEIVEAEAKVLEVVDVEVVGVLLVDVLGWVGLILRWLRMLLWVLENRWH